jgi:glycosyltransferase involved in cell wall biosynthesis
VARVLVISLSDLGRDARVDRQIRSLSGGHEVLAAGFGAPRDGIASIPLVEAARGTAGWWSRRLAMELLRTVGADLSADRVQPGMSRWRIALSGTRPDLVIANDMSAVPLAFEAAGNAPVVIDLHEYAPREHEENLLWRLTVAPQTRRLLRRFLPRAAELITVNNPIAETYAGSYGRTPVVITNAAAQSHLAPTPVTPGRIRMVHHGAALRGRRLETMIDLVKALDSRFTLDLFLVGDPSYVAELQARAGSGSRIRLHEPLAMGDIVKRLNEFDVGLYLLAPTNFNNLYALPNKFFDFVQARLAVAIGPSPAMAELVRDHGFGIVADSFDPDDLRARLQDLDEEKLGRLKRAADSAAEQLNAERNAEIMRGLVDRVLSGG